MIEVAIAWILGCVWRVCEYVIEQCVFCVLSEIGAWFFYVLLCSEESGFVLIRSEEVGESDKKYWEADYGRRLHTRIELGCVFRQASWREGKMLGDQHKHLYHARWRRHSRRHFNSVATSRCQLLIFC